MDWDVQYEQWWTARSRRENAEAQRIVVAARKRVSESRTDSWAWLCEALMDREKKWFVATLFRDQPVPRRLFQPMMDASVVDVDASSNRFFIEPCVETFGNAAVMEALAALKASGRVSDDKITMALYWAKHRARKVRSLGRKVVDG